ncbi:MAG: C40 family peptidase [Paenibacillaceae bacterium]|nr:C40 family peptidase [Paenibacillaceae bacterium]
MPTVKHTAAGAALLLSVSLSLTACGTKHNAGTGAQTRQQSLSGTQAGARPNPSGSAGPRIMSMTTDDKVDFRSDGSAAMAVTTREGKDYVQANQLLDTLGFQISWDAAAHKLRFGDNDAAFELSMDARSARKEGRTVPLAEAPILIGDKPYLPVSAVDELLNDDITFSVREQQFILHPTAKQTTMDRDAGSSGAGSGGTNGFADDPADPVKAKPNHQANQTGSSKKTVSTVMPRALQHAAQGPFGNEALPAAASSKTIGDLIDYAKRYLGVKYEFGAAPYSESGAFDCSSFTGHVFDKFGVDLPRTAREQATKGQSVSKSSLRVGDLVFFNIPGRFRNNHTVGHVGIYLGDQKMIDADTKPKDGVQISDLSKPFWIDNYLSARRVL